jgi:hypothetical protein
MLHYGKHVTPAKASEWQRWLGAACTDTECVDLTDFYGQERQLSTVSDIVTSHVARMISASSSSMSFNDKGAVHEIVRWVTLYGTSVHRFAQQLDEEQERELEVELEVEEEIERPAPTNPRVPVLATAVKNLAYGMFDSGDSSSSSSGTSVFRHIADALNGTTLEPLKQSSGWSSSVYATMEYCTVLAMTPALTSSLWQRKELLDDFVRAPKWVMLLDSVAILVSPYEANKLMPLVRTAQSSGCYKKASLHMIAPRMHLQQSVLVHDAALTTPSAAVAVFDAAQQWRITQLLAFAGTLYFESSEEEHVRYTDFIGMCTRPRTAAQQQLFDSGKIERSGFVPPATRQSHTAVLEHVQRCTFNTCPVQLTRAILQLRGHDASQASHVASVLRSRCVDFTTTKTTTAAGNAVSVQELMASDVKACSIQ